MSQSINNAVDSIRRAEAWQLADKLADLLPTEIGMTPLELAQHIEVALAAEGIGVNLDASAEHYDLVADQAHNLICTYSDDPYSALSALASLAASELCELCMIDRVHSTACDGSGIERLEVAHRDPHLSHLASEVRRYYPTNPAAPFGALRISTDNQEKVIHHITESHVESAAVDDDHRRLLELLDMRSYIGIPIYCEGKVEGVIAFVTTIRSELTYLEHSQEHLLARRLAREAAKVICKLGDESDSASTPNLEAHELLILKLRDQGKTTQEIAPAIGVTPGTLRNIHYRNINCKCNTSRINYALALAKEQGLL